MRRTDREMGKDFALEIADKCEFASLSMLTPSNSPYCIPLSIVREENAIYFHCAKNGLKTDCLKTNPQVCLVCVGDTLRAESEFTTEYESAIIRGRAQEILKDEDKIHALRLLCERHTPANMAAFDEAIQGSLHRTAVWRIEITEITGKRKKYGRAGKELKFGKRE